jgi:hypothetical protein
MNDAIAAMFWLTATVVLGGCAFAVSRRWFPDDGFAATTIHVISLCWSSVVGVTLLLSVQGLLTPALLMLSVVVCAAGGVWFVRGDQVGRNKSSQFRHAPHDERLPQRRNALFGPAWMWGAVASVLVARVILHGLLRLPDDWDTLAYHLPLLSHWIKSGTLYAPDCAFGYVPGNNEILGLWATAPFSGDFLIHLNNIVPAILLAVAAFELCLLMGVVQPLAHLSALSIISMRPMFRQLVSAENDLAVAALFLATLVYAIRFAKHQRLPDVWLAASTFGLLIGIKYYAIGYAGVAGLGLLGLVWATRGGRMAVKAFEIGLLGALLFGSYWYARNAWHYGAPLFPKSMAGGPDLWDEIRPDSHTSSLFYGSRREVWTLLARAIYEQAGPIALSAMLLLPASIGWCVVSALQKERSREAAAIRLTLAGVMSLAAIVYGVTPNVIETKLGTMDMLLSQYHPVRFGLCFYSISMIGLALIGTDLTKSCQALEVRPRWSSVLVFAVVVGHWFVGAIWQFIQNAWRDTSFSEWLLTCNLFLLSVVVILCWTSRSSVQRVLVLALVAASIPFTAWGVATLSWRWHTSFREHYDEWMTGGALVRFAKFDSRSERICVCDSRYYPFLGSRRQFNACRPLWFGDESEFLQYLSIQRISVLVVRTSGTDASERYAPIRSWVVKRPKLFRPVHENRYTIFRVSRDALADVSCVLNE